MSGQLRERRAYELSRWDVEGPREPIPLLLYRRAEPGSPRPAVVLYHGVTQSKDAYIDGNPVARRLTDAGFAVVVPDAPGHGERPSGPELVGRLRKSLAHEFCCDIEQAGDEAPALLDWLESLEEVDASRIGVAGISMGGFTAAFVASRLNDRLRAAVCVAGCGDLRECMARTDSIGPDGWGPPDRAIDGETEKRIERIDPLGHPDRFPPLPLLLLHGSEDTWNPCVTSERFAAALRPQYSDLRAVFDLRIVPGALHWPPAPEIVDQLEGWLTEHI
ncbi:MAG TPA: alpha/beta fold hydrolase [Candidatus Dormibacteraeota bacterium]|nr:alpha/beta fold hydrolase [Candidatus Dormibacteraeota bacterium]